MFDDRRTSLAIIETAHSQPNAHLRDSSISRANGRTLAAAQVLEGLLVAKRDLTGAHHQLQARVDVVRGFLLLDGEGKALGLVGSCSMRAGEISQRGPDIDANERALRRDRLQDALWGPLSILYSMLSCRSLKTTQAREMIAIRMAVKRKRFIL